eukprot:symbB.v1.2.031322.t1/scaffold3625.1/size53071/2
MVISLHNFPQAYSQDHGSANLQQFAWKDGCQTIREGENDIMNYTEARACWAGCMNALPDALLGSWLATWHRQAMNSYFGVVFSRFTHPLQALLGWYACAWVVVVAMTFFNLFAWCSVIRRPVALKQILEAIDTAPTATSIVWQDSDGEGPLHLCGGGLLSSSWGLGVRIKPESFDDVREILQREIGRRTPEDPEENQSENEDEDPTLRTEGEFESEFAFYKASHSHIMNFLWVFGMLYASVYVTLHCWFCIVLEVAVLAASWVSDLETIFQRHAWAERWLEIPLDVRNWLRLTELNIDLPVHLVLLTLLLVLLAFCTLLFDQLWKSMQQMEKWTNKFFCTSLLLDILLNGLGMSAALTRLTSLIFFVINAVFLFLWALSPHGGLVWSCSKAYSAFLFGRLPHWAPLAIGGAYGCFSLIHGLMLPPLPTPDDLERPKSDKRNWFRIPDTWTAKRDVLLTAGGTFFDTIMDVAQSCIFFRLGQPFYAMIIFAGVGMQFCILWIHSLRRGVLDIQSLVAAVLQSDTIQACLASWREGMLLTEMYQKTYREAATESYFSLLVGLFGLATTPIGSKLEIVSLLVSVLFSLKCVINGVSYAAEILAAEEEISSMDSAVPYAFPLISKNHYYDRKKFASNRHFGMVFILRLCEAVAVGCTLATCMKSSSVFRTLQVCAILGLLSYFVVFAFVVRKAGWTSLHRFTRLWESNVGIRELEGEWQPVSLASTASTGSVPEPLYFRGGKVDGFPGKKLCRVERYQSSASVFRIIDEEEDANAKQQMYVYRKNRVSFIVWDGAELRSDSQTWTRKADPVQNDMYFRAAMFVLASVFAGAFALCCFVLVVPVWQVMFWSGSVTRPGRESDPDQDVVRIPFDFGTQLSQKCIWLLMTWSLLLASCLNQNLSPFSLSDVMGKITSNLRDSLSKHSVSSELIHDMTFLTETINFGIILFGCVASILLPAISHWLQQSRTEWMQADMRLQFHLVNSVQNCSAAHLVALREVGRRNLLNDRAIMKFQKDRGPWSPHLGLRPSRKERHLVSLVVEAAVDAYYGKAERLEFKCKTFSTAALMELIKKLLLLNKVRVPSEPTESESTEWQSFEDLGGWHLCGGHFITTVRFGEAVDVGMLQTLKTHVDELAANDEATLVFSKPPKMNNSEVYWRQLVGTTKQDVRLSNLIEDTAAFAKIFQEGCNPNLPAAPLVALSHEYEKLSDAMRSMRSAINLSNSGKTSGNSRGGFPWCAPCWACGDCFRGPCLGNGFRELRTDEGHECCDVADAAAETLANEDGRLVRPGLWGRYYCGHAGGTPDRCGPQIGRQCKSCNQLQIEMDNASPLKCPGGHPERHTLCRSTRPYGCDVCKEGFSGGDHHLCCETCNLDYCLECGEALRRWATASGGQIPQLDDLRSAANNLQVTAGRLEDDLSALQINSPGIPAKMLRTAMMLCESDPQGLAEKEAALDSLRMIATYAADDHILDRAIPKLMDCQALTSQIRFVRDSFKKLSGNISQNAQQAEQGRCLTFLRMKRVDQKNAKEAVKNMEFLGLLKEAVEHSFAQTDALDFLFLHDDPKVWTSLLEKKKDEHRRIANDIQFWHDGNIQQFKGKDLISSGHPYPDKCHKMSTRVTIPQANGLTVVFSARSATFNSNSHLSIAVSEEGRRSRSNIVRQDCSGADRDNWKQLDVEHVDSLFFEFQSDGKGTADERHGFSAVVLPRQHMKQHQLDQLSQELAWDELGIEKSHQTRIKNVHKFRASNSLLALAVKRLTFQTQNESLAQELLHFIVDCIQRTSLDLHTAEWPELGLKSIRTLVNIVRNKESPQQQAKHLFGVWVDQVQQAAKAGLQDIDPESSEEWKLAAPVVFQVGQCMQDTKQHLLESCLVVLEQMHEKISAVAEQYAFLQCCMKYSACFKLSDLIESGKLPGGVQIVQCNHPYPPCEHTITTQIEVGDASEVCMAFARKSETYDSFSWLSVGSGSLEPIKRHTTEWTSIDKMVVGSCMQIKFVTDGDGRPSPSKRWGFLALMGDSKTVSVEKLDDALKIIAETDLMNKLFEEAEKSEAEYMKVREDFEPQFDRLSACFQNPECIQESFTDLRFRACLKLAKLLHKAPHADLLALLQRWVVAFPKDLRKQLSDSLSAQGSEWCQWCFTSDGSPLNHTDRFGKSFFFCKDCSSKEQCQFCREFEERIAEYHRKELMNLPKLRRQ